MNQVAKCRCRIAICIHRIAAAAVAPWLPLLPPPPLLFLALLPLLPRPLSLPPPLPSPQPPWLPLQILLLLLLLLPPPPPPLLLPPPLTNPADQCCPEKGPAPLVPLLLLLAAAGQSDEQYDSNGMAPHRASKFADRLVHNASVHNGTEFKSSRVQEFRKLNAIRHAMAHASSRASKAPRH